MMASFSEGLALGKKVGLDPATIVQVLTTCDPWSSVKANSQINESRYLLQSQNRNAF
jgi:3-hydroxyisobutyrate dehydrogenase-like beta-hydroxyacid dehydrogenase